LLSGLGRLTSALDAQLTIPRKGKRDESIDFDHFYLDFDIGWIEKALGPCRPFDRSLAMPSRCARLGIILSIKVR
jgi:hypothetical protein